MMKYSLPKAACLLYGHEVHHLDHLAVLSILLRVPLIVTEENVEALARLCYPGIHVILSDYAHVALDTVKTYEVIFTCLPRDLFDDIFFLSEQLQQKTLHTIWCPHGNSDKGKNSFFMEALQKEKFALVYGKKMIDFFKEKNVFSQLESYVEIGNYRYDFYQKEKNFYQGLVQKQIKDKLVSGRKTILYAPTWKDRENSSSFFDACSDLIEKLPSSYNLLIKLHPNLVLQEKERTCSIIEKYEGRQNVLFLQDFSPIYPLLDMTDIYLGDMSSIGYDFLTFSRPMYFLNQNERNSQTDSGLYLYQCGVSILPKNYQNIYEIIEKSLPRDGNFSGIRKRIYEETFCNAKPLDSVKDEITLMYQSISVQSSLM
jgi:hypothetical protein